MENGIQTIFPVYLPRMEEGMDNDDYNGQLAQNENAINQNFEILYRKLLELEEGV